ncbi:MAG: hypothetical protein M1837_005086 [Sclerophora amabilis]|nr:MAG: hypothetical protein M1837_005086 [Sclerophora amabilis]
MATYEVEHNIPSPRTNTSGSAQPPPAPRRPDLSTFFTAVSAVDTSTTQNTHAVPTPAEVSVAYRMLASAFEVMRRDGEGGAGTTQEDPSRTGSDPERSSEAATAAAGSYTNLMDMLIESLMQDAESPPREVKGCPQEFLDGRAAKHP